MKLTPRLMSIKDECEKEGRDNDGRPQGGKKFGLCPSAAAGRQCSFRENHFRNFEVFFVKASNFSLC